jgi:pimeloyl-ACP methyl ester carboxylesterase
MADIVLADDRTRRPGRLRTAAEGGGTRPDCRDLLPSIAVPTLVVGGAEDRVTPPALQEEIAAGIPGARLMLLDNCGHLAPMEQPQTVSQAMRDWLS